jgi:hypothetical protein
VSFAHRLLYLRAQPPFDGLSEAEIVAVADAASTRQFAPGEVVAPEGRPLASLHVVAQGAVLSAHDHAPLPPVFGAISLLNREPIAGPLVAGPVGAEVIFLARPHFFTLVTECPWLLVDLLSGRGDLR